MRPLPLPPLGRRRPARRRSFGKAACLGRAAPRRHRRYRQRTTSSAVPAPRRRLPSARPPSVQPIESHRIHLRFRSNPGRQADFGGLGSLIGTDRRYSSAVRPRPIRSARRWRSPASGIMPVWLSMAWNEALSVRRPAILVGRLTAYSCTCIAELASLSVIAMNESRVRYAWLISGLRSVQR